MIRPKFFLLLSLVLGCGVLQAQSPARIQQPIDDNNMVTLNHSTHPLANAVNEHGRVDANLPMERMMLVLKPSEDQKAAMLKLIDGQHNPESPSYRQWLTPEEFGAKFGPADEDVAKVVAWLQQQGFKVNTVGRGKQFVEFSGSAGQVENAFRTEMHHYQVNGVEHTANATDISLPQALTPVVSGVLSLHDFHSRPSHSKSFRVHRDAHTGELTPDFTLSTQQGSAHFLAPADFARIYNTEPLIKEKNAGKGISIAVIGRSNVDLSDVQTFRKIFGLPARDPIFILNGEDPGVVGNGEDEEADLDIEWSGAGAPEATIKFVLSGSTISTDGVDLSIVYAIDNVVAPIMTTSFSQCEINLGPAGNAFFKNIYEQAATEGVSAFVSTGDTGPAACSRQVENSPATLQAVSGLASTPFNTAVGGTAFAENGLDGNFWEANDRADLSSALGYIPEGVWNESCDPTKDPGQCGGTGVFFIVAGSGGPSSCVKSTIVNGRTVCQAGYAKPSWQAGFGVPSDGVRDLPDLSLSAGAGHDGYLLCVQGSCQTATSNGQTILQNASVIGGTSASTPSMAGIMALVEQKNGAFQGLANFNFYKLAARDVLAKCNSSNLTDPTQPANCAFHDVTLGSNAVPGLAGFPAKKGFDLSTGLGTVDAARVVAGWRTAPKLASVTTLSTKAISAIHGHAVPINVNVRPRSGTGAPSGAIDLFTDRFGTALGGDLVNGGFAGSVNKLPGGDYTVTAHYGGDAMFSASNSGTAAVHIAPEDAAVTVAPFEINLGGFLHPVFGPLLYGQPTTLDIRVGGVSGTGAATGTVTVSDGATKLGTFSLARAGKAFVQIDGLPAATGLLVGNHAITVAYSGDNSFKAAVSAPVKLSVIKKTPVTIITPAPLTVTAGSPVEMKLVVGGGGLTLSPGVELPSGTVQVFDGENPISGQLPLTLNGLSGPGAAQAVFSTSSFAPGQHNLTLHYSGNSNYNPADSFPFTFPAVITVNPAKGIIPSIALAQSPKVVTLGQSANYVVKVRPPKPGGAIPTGSISLVSNNDLVLAGPIPLISGNGSTVITFAAAGPFPVLARYSGDKTYSSASSSILNTQVGLGTPIVTLQAAARAVKANTQTSLTVSVTGAPANPILSRVTPFGTVQFMDSVNGGAAKPLGSPASLIPGNGGRSSIFTLPVVLPLGANLITVRYGGDSNWAATTSMPVAVAVK